MFMMWFLLSKKKSLIITRTYNHHWNKNLLSQKQWSPSLKGWVSAGNGSPTLASLLLLFANTDSQLQRKQQRQRSIKKDKNWKSILLSSLFLSCGGSFFVGWLRCKHTVTMVGLGLVARTHQWRLEISEAIGAGARILFEAKLRNTIALSRDKSLCMTCLKIQWSWRLRVLAILNQNLPAGVQDHADRIHRNLTNY